MHAGVVKAGAVSVAGAAPRPFLPRPGRQKARGPLQRLAVQRFCSVPFAAVFAEVLMRPARAGAFARGRRGKPICLEHGRCLDQGSASGRGRSTPWCDMSGTESGKNSESRWCGVTRHRQLFADYANFVLCLAGG